MATKCCCAPSVPRFARFGAAQPRVRHEHEFRRRSRGPTVGSGAATRSVPGRKFSGPVAGDKGLRSRLSRRLGREARHQRFDHSISEELT